MLGSRGQRGSHLFYKDALGRTAAGQLSQARRGMAEEYQVRQVINAIDKLEETNG